MGTLTEVHVCMGILMCSEIIFTFFNSNQWKELIRSRLSSKGQTKHEINLEIVCLKSYLHAMCISILPACVSQKRALNPLWLETIPGSLPEQQVLLSPKVHVFNRARWHFFV